MKEFYLDTHTDSCVGQQKNENRYGIICESNPERLLFFVGTQFIIITYNRCISQYYDEFEFKQILIKKVIGEIKVFPIWEVNRSVNIANDLKEFRIRNRRLKKHIQQVNYLYQNNRYAITTKVKYIDTICDQDEINQNYQKAKEFLIKNEYHWLLADLEQLLKANKVYGGDYADYHSSIDSLVTSINKLTK